MDIIKLINGVIVSQVCFAANMLCVNLGANRKYEDYKGVERETYEISLHIQAPWRVTKGSKIIIASADIGLEDSFENMVEQINLIKTLLFSHKVSSFEISEEGDLKLYISNGYILEVFIDSFIEECWRIILFDYNCHAIYLKNSISIEYEPSMSQ